MAQRAGAHRLADRLCGRRPAAGAAIGLTATFFFKVDDVRLHAVMVALLAAFIGLVIFMILAFDRPFRGDVGLDADPYPQVYDVVMQDVR